MPDTPGSSSSSDGGGKRSGVGKLLDKLVEVDAKQHGELGFECGTGETLQAQDLADGIYEDPYGLRSHGAGSPKALPLPRMPNSCAFSRACTIADRAICSRPCSHRVSRAKANDGAQVMHCAIATTT